MNLVRKLKCRIGWCACRPACDETGCWGECVHCGKRVGFVSRRVLSSYGDLVEAIERHRAVVKSETAN